MHINVGTCTRISSNIFAHITTLWIHNANNRNNRSTRGTPGIEVCTAVITKTERTRVGGLMFSSSFSPHGGSFSENRRGYRAVCKKWPPGARFEPRDCQPGPRRPQSDSRKGPKKRCQGGPRPLGCHTSVVAMSRPLPSKLSSSLIRTG